MIFKPAARYPADPRVVFIFALSVFSGITTLTVKAAPQSLESVLPTWAVMTWGIILCLGSLISLVGIARNSANGVLLEQVGSVMVAAATIFYSVVALMVVGVASLSVTGIVLAWGLANLVRWIQLQVLINSAYRDQVREEVRKSFLSDLKNL